MKNNRRNVNGETERNGDGSNNFVMFNNKNEHFSRSTSEFS